MQANQKVNYRYFVQPSVSLIPYYKYLDFGNTQKMIETGRQDMQKVIEMGPGKSFDRLRNNTMNL